MTLQDPFAHPGRDHSQRARWRRTWDGVRLRVRLRPAQRWRAHRRQAEDLLGSTSRMRLRARRRLAAMEAALSRDTPQLAAMFNLFTQLTTGEQVQGAEQMPAPPKPRIESAHVAVLMTLAAIAALCLALSTQIHPVARQCTSSPATSATVSSTTSATGQTPAPGQSAMGAQAADAASAMVRGLDCAAYPTNK
jgi:hypothetical protein